MIARAATAAALAVAIATGAAAQSPPPTPPTPPPAPARPAGTLPIDDSSLADRPIAAVTVLGLQRLTPQAINNNIRVAAGQPFEARSIREDIATLYRLGHFATVTAEAQLRTDGTVEVIYTVVEQPVIRAVSTAGNKIASDEELLKVIRLYAGGPRDDFLLQQSIKRIKDLYLNKGNYLVEVSIDEKQFKDTGVLIFRIIEGPRVRVQEIEFAGNASFGAEKLYAQIKSRTAIPLVRKGALDEELLVDDVAAVDRFYKDMGFVDVRVDRRVVLSADSKDAKIIFTISEGRRYRLRDVIVRGADAEGNPVDLHILSPEQIRSLLVIRKGDWFTRILIDKSVDALRGTYGVMGYIDTEIETSDVRVGDAPEVDLVVALREGPRTIIGLVLVQGNFLTKDQVIRRLFRGRPGRPYDLGEQDNAKKRTEASGLFNGVRITPQLPRPGDEDPLGDEADEAARAAATAGDPELVRRLKREVRDVLIEVKERNTGAVNFGVGVGTDTGAFGQVSISQKNFDIADPPLSLEELYTGRAFRGAGQGFSVSLAPGNVVSNYSVNFVEPHLFESDLVYRFSAFYRSRFFNSYDEDRTAVSTGLSRRLGDLWTIGVNAAVQRVELSNFEPSTPLEVVDDAGPSTIANTSFTLSRTDTDKPLRPTRGTQIDMTLGEYYNLDSDETWSLVRLGGTAIFTVDEDYLGRRSTLKLNGDVAYIFAGEPPLYDRLYLGGRNFRGFAYRTVSPKSRGSIGAPTTPNDKPIGGDWLLFLGAQYEVPIFAEYISGVLFMDTGTVATEPGFDDYRVSVGFGLRIYIPQLGPAPLAFDFGFPIKKADQDESQIFSFSAELPF